jgi:hypothetical protein
MQAAEFATGLLTALFSRIDKPFRMRIGTALSQGEEAARRHWTHIAYNLACV